MNPKSKLCSGALAGCLMLSLAVKTPAQSPAEPAHPILTISGSGSGASTILSTYTEAQYTNSFVPQQGPRDDLFADNVVPNDTGWSWSTSAPNQVTSTPSGVVFPTSSYQVKTQAVLVLSGKTIGVPYYTAVSGKNSLVYAYIDYMKRAQLRSDFNKLAPAYVNSGSSPATRNDAYARRIAVALDEWANHVPDYFMTEGWNKNILCDSNRAVQIGWNVERSSDHNGLAHEWEDNEIYALDAIYDSVALTTLSAERGYDVRQHIINDLFFNIGDFFLNRVPLDTAIGSNLSGPYTRLAMVARVLNRPDYILWLDNYLDATVRLKIKRDGTLGEGIGYSIGYLNENSDAAKAVRDYFLTRPANTPDLIAISNHVGSYVSTLQYGQAQWGAAALPNGQAPSFGDTPFNTYFTARNAGNSALLPAYGHVSMGTGAGSQSVQVNQSFPGNANHMRADISSFVLWAFNNEILGNIRYFNGTPGRQFGEQILAHNAVTIDRVNVTPYPPAPTYGNGDLMLYEAGNNGLAVTEIDGQRDYSNKASRYQRILLLNSADLNRPYVVDVMRVTGGTNHDYTLHGSIRFDQTWQCSFPLVTNPAPYPMLEGETWVEPATSYSSFPYYGFWRNVSSNQAPGNFQVTYRDTNSLHRDLRLWMTDDGTAKVFLGMTPIAERTDTTPPNFYKYWRPSLIVRKRIPSGTLQDLFVSVVEPLTNGVSTIQSVDRLPVAGGNLDAVALRITFTDGRVDTYIVNLNNPKVAGATAGAATVSTADGQYTLTGRIGVQMERASGSRCWTVNAGDFQYPGRRLTTPNQYYSGLILGETRKLTGGSNDAFYTSTPLPLGTALRGKQISVTFGALSGSGTQGISEMFQIDQVLLTNGQYYICFANDHMLEITNSATSVEQMAPNRTFSGTNQFELALSASASPISPLADVTVPVSGTTGPLGFNFGTLGSTAGSSLQVLATASNPALVPAGGLVIGGSGTNRTLTITPAAGTNGTAVITVSVTDGVWTNSRSFKLVVSSFLLTASPASQTVAVGSTNVSYTATVTSTNGFTNNVTFAVSGVPTGAGATFSPASINGAGSSVLTVTTSNTIVAGDYTLTLTAASGSLMSTTTVDLVVAGASSLRWNSTSSSVWDTNLMNWLNLGNGAGDVFQSEDSVLFDDTPGVVTSITLGTTVVPALLTVNASTNSFVLSGSGKLSGSAGIVKSGSGTLTLSTANDFSGPVTIAGGVLKAGNALALGAASGNTIVTNAGTLDVNTFNISGEPVVVSGDGAGGGGAIVNNGTAAQTTALKYVTLAGNTTFGGTARWDIRGSPASLLTSPSGSPYAITKVGTNQVSLVAVTTIDAALGDIDVQQGIFGIQTTTTQVGDPNKTITVHGGATLDLYRLTNSPLNKRLFLADGATIYSENDSNVILGPVTLDGNATFNVNSAGSNPSLNFNNALGGPGGITKTGAAPLILRATNTYSGSTLVSAGALMLMDSGSISNSSTITLAANSTLDVNGRIDKTLALADGQTLQGVGTVAGNLSVGPGAAVAPGLSAATLGTLVVGSNVTLQGTVCMKLTKAGAPTNDMIQAGTNIAYGGTLMLTNLAGTLAAGDAFRLFFAPSYSGAFTNIAPAIPAINLAWNTNGLSAGTVSIVSAPTRPPRLSGAVADGTSLVISGSSGVPGWTFYVLATTNLAVPLANWTVVATNTFDASGQCVATNAIDPNTPQRFYRLQLR
jgi:autotransporter-associated beta strand protein